MEIEPIRSYPAVSLSASRTSTVKATLRMFTNPLPRPVRRRSAARVRPAGPVENAAAAEEPQADVIAAGHRKNSSRMLTTSGMEDSIKKKWAILSSDIINVLAGESTAHRIDSCRAARSPAGSDGRHWLGLAVHCNGPAQGTMQDEGRNERSPKQAYPARCADYASASGWRLRKGGPRRTFGDDCTVLAMTERAVRCRCIRRRACRNTMRITSATRWTVVPIDSENE